MATETGTTAAAEAAGDKPHAFLYCDYWASVLGLGGVMRSVALRRGFVDRALFRACLDRPETRLPGLGYYLLTLFAGPALIPYRVLQHIRSTFRLHLPDDDSATLLAPHRLAIEPEPGNRVRLDWCGETVAKDLFDPYRAEVLFSLVYPTYKLLFSALVAIALALGSQWVLHAGLVPHALEGLVRFAHYPLVVLLSWVLFRDGITAVIGPLPVYVVVGIMRLAGSLTAPHPSLFIAALVSLALAYFLVDAFLVPRGLEPTLYFYDADPESPMHSYEPGQAPAWLAGQRYWVWRFMYCTAAELNKVWERDWERVEAWVRADGPDAGDIEWIVVDFHYRELWLPKARLVSAKRATEQRCTLDALRAGTESLAWMVETDMNVVFHSPEVRGVYSMPLEGGWRRARLRQLLASFRVEARPDPAHEYRPGVRRLRVLGHDFVADIPEHFRNYALRQLLRTPWRYWRYPRGANTAARSYLYSRSDDVEPLLASEIELQLKSRPRPEQ